MTQVSSNQFVVLLRPLLVHFFSLNVIEDIFFRILTFTKISMMSSSVHLTLKKSSQMGGILVSYLLSNVLLQQVTNGVVTSADEGSNILPTITNSNHRRKKSPRPELEQHSEDLTPGSFSNPDLCPVEHRNSENSITSQAG